MKTKNLKTINKNIRLYDNIVKKLTEHGIRAYTRTTKTNSVHLIVHLDGAQYSVVRFAHHKTFRIFYPAYKTEQTKVDREHWYDVVNYFTARE